MVNWLIRIGTGIALVILALTFVNASWLAGEQRGRLNLVAHGGIYQSPADDAEATACPSARIAANQRHEFIANTLSSINYALSRSAQRVHVSMRPTADGRLVLFGDETVDCRTDGEGAVAELALDELKALDIGYGLTADGEEFPYRGRDRGGIASLDEALRQFNGIGLILDFRSDDPAQAAMLAAEFERAGREPDEDTIVMGGSELLAAIAEALPEVRRLDNDAAEACLDDYVGSGWYGSVPESCRETGFVSVPLDRQWMVWGFPNRFGARMRSAGVTPYVVASHDGDAIQPLTTLDQMSDVPREFKGLLWLSDIYDMGPALRP